MKKLITPRNIAVLALTTPALIGDIAGLICCAVSAGYGLRRVVGARAC